VAVVAAAAVLGAIFIDFLHKTGTASPEFNITQNKHIKINYLSP